MRFLARLERSLGWLAVGRLPIYIVSAQVLVYLAGMINPDMLPMLVMDPDGVRAGEYWRVVTFLFVSPFPSPIWTFIYLYFQYVCGMALEDEWGSFPFTVFYLVGALSSIGAAFLVEGRIRSAFYLNETIFLAFAALYPDYQVLLFFILPLKIKWIAWLSWIRIALGFAFSPWLYRAAILLSLLNYFLFFGHLHYTQIRDRIQSLRHRRRFRDWK